MSSVNNDSNAKLSERYAQQREQIIKSEEERLKNIRENYKEKIQTEEDSSEASINHISTTNKEREAYLRSQGQKNVQQIQEKTKTTLTNEQEQSNKKLSQIQNRTQENYKNLRDSGEKRIQETIKKNESEIQAQNENFETKSKTNKEQYQKEIAETHKKGDQTLTEENQRFEKNNIKQKNYQKTEMTELKAQHEAQKEEAIRNHEQQKQKQEVLFKKDSDRQKTEQQEKYLKSEEFYKAALSNQRDIFNRELATAQKNNAKKLNIYSEKQNDPFYSLSKINARFIDNDGAYIIAVKVPEHEIKNVDVIVQKDKLVVTGNRSWKDDIIEEGVRSATSRYETVREEFPIEKAIKEKAVVRTYRDGILKVVIPKA